MCDFLNRMIGTGYRFIDVAKKMMLRCRLKENKVCSRSRFIISYFINRGVELSESILILIKANRFVDSALLLRSLWELGIDADYIFSKTEIKEINAIKYLLNQYKSQITLLSRNIEECEAAGLKAVERIKEKKDKLEKEQNALEKEYKVNNWKWPHISIRAGDSEQWVVRQAYKQIYTYLCSIEHHDISFGQLYADDKKCEPLKEITHSTLIRPELTIFMCRAILLVIMKTFNEEFGQEWEGILKGLEEQHDMEYEEMKKEDGIV